jgi:type I restriction enzyme, S subunit
MNWKPYPEYKNSNIHWLGNIPTHWESEYLRWCLKIESGEFLPNSNIEKDNPDLLYPVIGGNGILGYSKEKNTTETTIVIGRVGALCGNVHKIISPSWITDNALIITELKKYDMSYLTLLLSSMNLNHLANQNAQPLITGGMIKELRTPLPSLEEQKFITSFLGHETERIDNLISKKQRQIELLQEKRAALISHAVTKGLNPDAKMKDTGVEWLGEIPEHWREQRIKYSSYIKGRIGWQNLRSEEFTTEGPFLITGMHFKDGGIDWDSCFHVTEERYLMAPEIFVQLGDVLITKDGSIGKLAYIEYLPGKATLNSHLLVIRPQKNNLRSRFLYYLLGSQIFQHFVLMEKSGTTFYGITQESIENFTIPIPPLTEQSSLIEYLDKKIKLIDELVQAIIESIQKLEEYRNAIISAAVTGKIDVRQEAA